MPNRSPNGRPAARGAQKSAGSKAVSADVRATRTIFLRALFLMGLFGLCTFCVLVWKLYTIQIRDHAYYEERAVEQQTRSLTVSAERGTIRDAEGHILAISATVQNVVLSPKDIQENKLDADLIADGLSALLGVNRDTVYQKTQKANVQYEIVKRRVEQEDEAAVRAFIKENKLTGGVYLEPDTKRYYPYGTLAAHVIGFVGTENTGLYGVEARYESFLQGEAGRVVTAKTGKGTEMLYKFEQYYDAERGADVDLTINSTIQYYCSRILAEGIEKFEVRKGGFAIVMNVKTGAILGWAMSPDYDLNSFSSVLDGELSAALEGLEGDAYSAALREAQLSQWKNRGVTDTYEPGSTFKALVLSMALEEGLVNEKSTFSCSGSVQVGGFTIHCHKAGGHGSQTLSQAVENSCNPAFIAIGQKVGAETFYDYLERYGLLTKTGVDMQAEGSSVIWSRDYFTSPEGATSLAVASFGQTAKFTPIQLLTAYAAVANGGYLLTPYVVSSVTAEDGAVLAHNERTVVRQVISGETSAQVRAILENVVTTGTGKNAYVAGYRIAGKTGTSEKRDEDTGDNIVSFLGFAPADDPEVVVLLAYDSPTPTSRGSNYTAKGYYISGGNMAAPMAGQLIGDILDYLGVEKQYTASELQGADAAVPGTVGKSLADAESAMKKAGFSVRTVGSGDTVTDQLPAAGASIPGGSQVVLYLGEAKPTDLVSVPAVTGLSAEAANRAITNAGLYMKATGAADGTLAVGQSLEAGSQTARGTVVEVQRSAAAVSV